VQVFRSATSRFHASLIHWKCRRRATASCRLAARTASLSCRLDNVIARIDEGVRVIAGRSEASAIKGRAHQKRKLPG